MRISISIVFIVFVTQFIGQNSAPKYSNEFLNIGVGARALGMSNSIVASSNDVHSGYWNPCGLTKLDSDLQIGLMHAEYFAGIAKYDYGAIAKRIDSSSAFAVSFVRFGVDNIPNTTELIDAQGNINYDRISYFSAADMALLLSYGKKLKKGLIFGGSAKIIHRQVGDFARAWGFGLDFSISYSYKKWQFAALTRDITSTFNAWSYNLSDEMLETFALTGNEIPQSGLEITLPRIIVGAARSFKLSENFNLITEIDADITTDGMRNVLISANPFSIDPHFGMELSFKKMIFLRTGIGNIQQSSQFNGKEITTVQPNIGLGIKIKGLSIDYALTDIGDASVALYSNIFSLRFNLNPKPIKN